MTATRVPFHDPLSGEYQTLVIDPNPAFSGVEHVGCARLAEVLPELDCASCSECHWQARISGAWYIDITDHLRSHLTDGHWHDRCPYCRHRRVHGGNGINAEATR